MDDRGGWGPENINVDAPVIGTVLNDIHRGSFGYYRKGKYYRKGYYRRSPEELEEQARQLEEVG